MQPNTIFADLAARGGVPIPYTAVLFGERFCGDDFCARAECAGQDVYGWARNGGPPVPIASAEGLMPRAQALIEQELGDAAASWPEARPLDSRVVDLEFPLSGLPELVRDAVIESAAQIGLRPAAFALTTLGALAALFQHSFDGQAPHGPIPLSLFVLLVGRPGSGKSPAISAALGWVADADRDLYGAYEKSQAEAVSRCALWEKEVAALGGAVEASIRKDDTAALPDLRRRHAALLANKPPRPEMPQIAITGNATPAALYDRLARCPSGCFILGEAAAFFGGGALLNRDTAGDALSPMLDSWSTVGIALDSARRNAPSVRIDDPRISFTGALQTDLFGKYLGKNSLFAEQGFIARTMIYFLDQRAPLPDEVARKYASEKLAAILQWCARELVKPSTESRRHIVPMAPSARTFIRRLDREILATYANDTIGFAAKYADHITKIATLVHLAHRLCEKRELFDANDVGEVQLEHVRYAEAVFRFYLAQHGALAARADTPAAMAERVEAMLRKAGGVLTRRELTDRLRPASALNAALELLAQSGRARIVKIGGAPQVELNPRLR